MPRRRSRSPRWRSSICPARRVELTVNGKPVDPLAFDGVSVNAANTVAVSRWRAVDLVDGNNLFVARVLDKDGSEAWRAERTVHFGGGPVRAEIDKASLEALADGRTSPVIALRMFDKYGKPARTGTLAAFTVDSPYRSMWEVDQLNDNQILSNGPREPQVEVGLGGLALIELEPTTTSGNAIDSPALQRAPERRIQGVAGARGARLDPGGHRRRHGRLQHDLRQHGNRRRRRPRRRLRTGWPRGVLRQGPHQGRFPADHGLRLGAREAGGARHAPAARSSPTTTIYCTATAPSSASRPPRRASCT